MKIAVDVTEDELMDMEISSAELHTFIIQALDEYGDFCGFDVEINVTD
ncbi:Uncharacterised protein [Klebsiella pneumoniae]|nr:hypothetical protein [Morganella morganii]SSN09455.1 Uncharacterised protein [Klebsiella pneumoniae]